jgi:predicted GH43/DUF377 family glycosyl hydrolase
MFVLKRVPNNPVLYPDQDHQWEALACFNWSPIRHGKAIHAFYRAVSSTDPLQTPHNFSTIGQAVSPDGDHWKDRRQFIFPEKEWEKYGCEDPRVTKFEGKYYIFYTALSNYPFNAEGIKVAVAVSDDLKTITHKHLVTPFNAKAMTLFPERINGKVTAIFSAHTDSPPVKTSIVQCDKIEDLWSPKFWEEWHQNIDEHAINLRRSQGDHVEVGATPIKTSRGWLFIYSHIQNYFETPDHFPRVFGIEAVLLNLKDPTKIIGRTKGPFLVPEEAYELEGYVPNITFPSGALVEKDTLSIYYGAADTTCCVAKVSLSDLLDSIDPKTSGDMYLKRFAGNPIITPIKSNAWESQATFNPAAIDLGGKVRLLYRALSDDNTSVFGYASLSDGFKIHDRLPEPVYVPRENFEMKKVTNGNSGCEDARLMKIGSVVYMCYTAFDSVGPPRVAATSISEEDFLGRKWHKWKKPILITPEGIDDKDTCFFPQKIKGKYMILHRIGSDICADYLDSLDFEKDKAKRCIKILGPRRNMWDGLKVGIAAPPVKTKEGWLLLYHGISPNRHTYRVGAVLLDLKDPTTIIARSTDPIFEPQEKYEKEGVISNVVFPCGMVIRRGILFVYYGGADKVVGGATMKLDVILSSLKKGMKLFSN